MELAHSNDLDVNIESTVVLALSRLQGKAKRFSQKYKRRPGVSRKKLVEFLKANYPWMDGDVESQVLTVLLACIKSGVVCALDNRKYLLIGTNPGKMTSKCVTRVFHGPKCSCLTVLNCLLKTFPRTCCVIKKPALKNATTKEPRGKFSPAAPPKRNQKKDAMKSKRICAQEAQKQFGTSRSKLSFTRDSKPKCNYCLEIHSLPKLRKLCMTCYPIEKFNGLPPDKFSPRDEATPCVEEPVNKT